MLLRIDRWIAMGVVALVLAIVPGVLHSVTAPSPTVDRASIATPLFDLTGVGSEVAITPPEEFTGPVATPDGPAPTFAQGPAATGKGEVFALLVGIDDYPGTRGDLDSAVADVETIDAALEGFGVPDGNRVILRDGQATVPAVKDAVRSLVTQGGPESTYVFAYAGHARKLDRDTEALALADGEVLRDSELAELVAPATTQRMWFLLSACYSGGFTEVLKPGRVLTAAASAFDLAWEDPALNGSYLVHYLVRQGWLQGKAGNSVQEAFAYADTTLARERPNRRPVQVDKAGGPLVLGAGDPTSAADLAPPLPPKPTPKPPPQQPPPPPPSPPTTAPPEKDCGLFEILGCGGG